MLIGMEILPVLPSYTEKKQAATKDVVMIGALLGGIVSSASKLLAPAITSIAKGASTIAPSISTAIAKIAPVTISAAKSVVSSPAGKTMVGVAAGGLIAGNVLPSREAIGIGAAAAVGGTPAGLLTALGTITKPSPTSSTASVVAPSISVPSSPLPIAINPAPSSPMTAEQLRQMIAGQKPLEVPAVFQQQIEAAEPFIESALTKVTEFVGKKPLETAAIIGGAAALTGVAVLAAKKKAPAKKKAAKKKAPAKKKAAKKKAPAKKKASKLKFGSPAWRKKYMKKKTKTGKKTKGKNPFAEVESRKNIGLTHKVGTEAQYKKGGGAKVYHTTTGQPYIILSTGKARFIRKS